MINFSRRTLESTYSSPGGTKTTTCIFNWDYIKFNIYFGEYFDMFMLSHPIQEQGISLYLFKFMCVSGVLKCFPYIGFVHCLLSLFLSILSFFSFAITNGVSLSLCLLITDYCLCVRG